MKPSNHRNTVKRNPTLGLTPICLLAALVVTTMTIARATGTDGAKQIKFSHKKHVAEQGVGCTDCHTEAAASKLATDNILPKMATCANCHDDQTKNQCTFCHTSADSTTYKAFAPASFDLLFPHEEHAGTQKMACETCHQGLEKDENGMASHIPAMTVCATCHNDIKVPNNCEKCHTNFAALRPADHNRNDFLHEHKFEARLGDPRCATCHTQESCIDCHSGASLVNVDPSGRDLVSPRAPRLTENDRGQGMRLTKVHDLNFRYTHGVTAAGRIDECRTCHDEQVFCTTCHESGGNITQLKIKPATHLQAGFVTLPGGDGGNHARLARRDIEQCAACHDAYDPDPTCMLCHKRAN